MTPSQSSSVQPSSVQSHPSVTTESTGPSREITARRAVAYAVRHIRRWDEAGIMAAFDAAVKRGYDFAAIAACLFDIAVDETAQTPGVLVSRLANGWRRKLEPPSPLPKLERCRDCGLRHPHGSPCGDPHGTPGRLEDARRELEQARAGLCVHGVPWGNCLQHESKEGA